MKDANLRAFSVIMGQLRQEVKRFSQMTGSKPFVCILKNKSGALSQFEKGAKKLGCKLTIYTLSTLLMKSRAKIPSKNLEKMVKTLNCLYLKLPPDTSELAPRETLRALIQALSLTSRTSSLLSAPLAANS